MRKCIIRLLCGLTILVIIALSINLFNKRLAFDGKVSAQTPAIDLVPVAMGLSSPLYLTNSHDGSGRLFIVEQPGRIKVIPQGASTPLATPFLDITSKVLFDAAERGLLGLAFHPQFITNHRFFVNYTRAGDGATVISEFQSSASNPNIAETDESIILTIPQPFPNNNGGMIEFGPDGYLYIGMGDGGAAYDPDDNAQNIGELLGKILRIDVDHPNGTIPYSSPSDNPFFGATPGRDEIFALGFRNPFRFSFDRLTGQLYAGDVGEDTKEEVDLVQRGGNYGWRVYEGNNCTSLGPAPCNPESFIPPIYEYDHSNGRCSVIGGYVYRGTQGTFPSGSYIFGDYCTGEVFMRYNNTVSLVKDTDLQMVSFGEDQAGELYVISQVDGSFYLFRLSAPPAQPTVLTASQASYSQNPLARESLVCGFGSGLANSIASTLDYLYTALGGATVTVTDSEGVSRFALINYVSPPQINFQLPPGTALGSATITYTNTLTGESKFSNTTVGGVNPGIFTVDGTGNWLPVANILRKRQGLPDVVEPTATMEGNQWVPVPLDLGPPTDQVILVLFGTGWRFRSDLSTVSVTVGGESCFLFYAGVDGSERTGIDQANVLLPRSLAGRGLVDLVMIVDGQTSNTVKVSIR